MKKIIVATLAVLLIGTSFIKAEDEDSPEKKDIYVIEEIVAEDGDNEYKVILTVESKKDEAYFTQIKTYLEESRKDINKAKDNLGALTKDLAAEVKYCNNAKITKDLKVEDLVATDLFDISIFCTKRKGVATSSSEKPMSIVEFNKVAKKEGSTLTLKIQTNLKDNEEFVMLHDLSSSWTVVTRGNPDAPNGSSVKYLGNGVLELTFDSLSPVAILRRGNQHRDPVPTSCK